jgi:hypothetical protein
MHETGRRVFIIDAACTADTKKRLYSIRMIGLNRAPELFENLTGLIEDIDNHGHNDSAAVYYFPPDTGGPPSFTFTEYMNIQKALKAKDHELILNPT